jgi:hypothetical protein
MLSDIFEEYDLQRTWTLITITHVLMHAHSSICMYLQTHISMYINMHVPKYICMYLDRRHPLSPPSKFWKISKLLQQQDWELIAFVFSDLSTYMKCKTTRRNNASLMNVNVLCISYTYAIHMLYICYTYVIHMLYICYKCVINMLYIHIFVFLATRSRIISTIPGHLKLALNT